MGDRHIVQNDLGRRRQDPQLELLQDPGADHQKQGRDHQAPEAVPAAEAPGAVEVIDPADDAAHQEGDRHDHGDAGGGQDWKQQGQGPEHQHQDALGNRETAQGAQLEPGAGVSHGGLKEPESFGP